MQQRTYGREKLSKEYIEKKLKASGISLKVEVTEETASTNTLLSEYAKAGECRDMLLLAEHQTGGRGRKGRSFHSPKGTGVYMSLLLHPGVPAGEVSMLTALAAAATAKAIEKVSGKEAGIKWVNDIFVEGKKAVGILTEASGTLTEGMFDYVIVGIGINVYEPEGGFPEEIRKIAGAVFSASEHPGWEAVPEKNAIAQNNGSKKVPSGEKDKEESRNYRSLIAIQAVKEFMAFYKDFPQKTYLEEYRSRSFLIGREVRVIPTEQITGSVEETGRVADAGQGQVPVYAKVLGIDRQCRLQVRYEDGREEFLSNGEVSIRER